MTFFESIKTVFRKYAEFDGRATRAEFWWFLLFSTLVSAALNALTLPFNGRMFEFDASASSVSTFASFAFVWSIAVLLPSLAVTVRRLRDTGREWTQLFWILLPIVGLIILIVHLAEPSVAAAVAPAETPRADAPAASD
ncbi:MAG: DUF805 domain-containing protein [Lacisediminihabitans sp.]